MLRKLFHKMLPARATARKLHFGPAKGAFAKIDFRLDAAFYFGFHERVLWRHYRGTLRPGMKCFDVGMYRGWDALTFAFMTGAAVLSFDLNEKCLEMTREFLEPSKLDENVTLVRAAVSDGDGDITIDEAAERYFQPDFIKIDVEGAEAAVLRGAHTVLSRKRPTLVVETHGLEVEAECRDLLRSEGYSTEVVERPRGIISEARSLEHNRWIVCHPIV